MSNQDINELPPLKVNVPSFLMKTYEILENPSLSHIITWNQDGNAFIVLNSHELSSKVLANYFKHKNYPSFLRQLNMYNFKKTKNHYGQSEFRHQWFRKGLKSMLQYIRRRNQDDSENKIEIKSTNIPKIDNYKQEHNEMKKIVQEIQTTQFQMEIDFSASMEQNIQSTRSSQTILQGLNQMQQQFNKKFDSLSYYLRLFHIFLIQHIQWEIFLNTHVKNLLQIDQNIIILFLIMRIITTIIIQDHHIINIHAIVQFILFCLDKIINFKIIAFNLIQIFSNQIDKTNNNSLLYLLQIQIHIYPAIIILYDQVNKTHLIELQVLVILPQQILKTQKEYIIYLRKHQFNFYQQA
ncbi:unnamed protein product [Paramecium pentaurelia]|uniref:HSF-type DNA-binding domain-containing protein n=1 Tax=Paramecium pentaurelia TaxID=43138 RepID=A0A8S1SW91_9CILI|nr:unnamed protein product [Paramecium pentaurelia]